MATVNGVSKLEDTGISHRAKWASIPIREQIAEIEDEIPALASNEHNIGKLAPIKATLRPEEGLGPEPKFKVGIVGAGVAGLFTALIFDHLKEKFGLDVEYEILEANSEDRVGGRLYSYYFKNVQEPSDHDYYDVGAMRFPHIDIMKRTFDLFEGVLGMKQNFTDSPSKGDLIKYYLQPEKGSKTPQLYNDVQLFQPAPNDKAVESDRQPTGRDFKIDDIPEKYMDQTPGGLVDEHIKKFTKVFNEQSAEAGWKNLMEHGDAYSVRQYLRKFYDDNVIDWLETYNYGNRWYDQAFSECVLEDLDFNHNKPWFAVEGGSQEAAHLMRKKIEAGGKKPISFGKSVTAMHYVDGSHDEMEVSVHGEAQPRKYDAVFNSAPLGSMQRMDLTGLNLNWGTKKAIRSLGYGASCKVGVRFKRMWWIEEPDLQIKGGVGKTDLPIRACVYPSYNMKDKGPGVLLVSYTWCQEAERLGALIDRNSPENEEALKQVLIHDLARLHSNTEKRYQELLGIIGDAYETHYAHDWYADPYTTGAFAYFGPGQFRNLYKWIIRNHGKHVIIGEVASAHHAWVVGALESAVRGVYQFLFRHSDRSEAAAKAVEAYNHDEIESPYGGLPAEYDRKEDTEWTVKDGKKEEVNRKYISRGAWARKGVLFEGIRLQQEKDKLDPTAIKAEQIAPLLDLAAK
ncbi:MAG: hypothetical protein M1831_006246 [Alyxoria varia]|nr:MAG: hypothetical protein M1831_006246 [Alyxoria varia]